MRLNSLHPVVCLHLPSDNFNIGFKWVYKTKLDAQGTIDKKKVWLVARGFTQQKGVGYDEIFAHVARMDTVQDVLATAA